MKGKRNRRLLLWIFVPIWLGIILAGAMLLSSFDDGLGAVVFDVFESGTQLPGAASGQSVELQVLPPTWTSGPAVTDTPHVEPTRAGTHEFIEPTFTPLVPQTPTPTFFITAAPFFEGPIVIGQTAAGRPIEVYRFGTGPVHRMIVAGIHGGYEWNTTALAESLMAHIQENPEIIPRTVTLYILPSLNPDGLARDLGVAGRVNENGVDLNRNFPANWAPDWERDLCWNYTATTGGVGPGSEPETQALINYVLRETRVTAIISYHSAALGIFPGGEPPHQPSVWLAESLAGVSTYPYPPIDIGCTYTGTLPDWAAEEGIASVDLELHNHEDIDFDENLDILKVFLNWRR